jgi:hypothetical protein
MLMPNGFKPLFIAALLMLVCACGSSTAPSAGVRALQDSRPGSGSRSGTRAQESVDSDLVAGVSPGGSDPPIGLKFRLDTRPVVGMPSQLVLALIPTPGVQISHIHGSLQVADGLQLQSPHSFDIAAPKGGAPLEQDVTVVPQRNGVLSLSATLVIDYDNGSIARTYVIPLIATSNAS